MKNNIVSVQINKIIEDNKNTIIVFANKNNIVSDIGSIEYKNKLFLALNDFIDEDVINEYKIFNIDSEKFSSEIIDFLYGISMFPLAIIFDNGTPKFIVPLFFD